MRERRQLQEVSGSLQNAGRTALAQFVMTWRCELAVFAEELGGEEYMLEDDLFTNTVNWL